MEKLINILALVSLIVSVLPTLSNFATIVLALLYGGSIKGSYFTVAFWLALTVWPILYWTL